MPSDTFKSHKEERLNSEWSHLAMISLSVPSSGVKPKKSWTDTKAFQNGQKDGEISSSFAQFIFSFLNRKASRSSEHRRSFLFGHYTSKHFQPKLKAVSSHFSQ